MTQQQFSLHNETVKNHSFLAEMYRDGYFPNKLVDKGTAILIDLCFQIEEKQPQTLEQLYTLTHLATDKFNDLQGEFEENDSEIETVARDCIGMDFKFIATAYGFKDADVEKLIATRDW
ncbi:hypothetical protein SAMN05421780_101413 [Flexibacter flexilis DSM 6793]|uniref:Uncharacterized protein n=1 Tax=Flexibacter flexilis DSM 6793 TaxID=927664 RepID=A0A1I1DXB1_9BACT|nr:DUF5713 family protein [Flexibacter flexilis]SFB77360.1 hypothetical protein SAMN05421780_101413 [Flexibacter flexilis DSM 6793]